MYEPVVIHKKFHKENGTQENFNPEAELQNSEIKATDKIEPPIVALMISNSIVSTLGNITTFIGKAKSRKTFFTTIAIAIAISKDYVFGLFSSHLPQEKETVILFDTEQSKHHVQKALLRICEMTEIKEPINLKVYGLRKYTPEERLEIIEHAINSIPNIGMIFIDGVKDLITSINDEGQATMIVSKLMKWTEEKNISIFTVIHQNKNDSNARGHLGTELTNKSETVISIERCEQDKNISVVFPKECRNIDFDPFGFEINETGIPVLAEDFEQRTTKKDKFEATIIEESKKYQLLVEVFKHETECSYSSLQKQLQRVCKTILKKDIGMNAVSRIITECKNNGWLIQEAKFKPYRLGNYDSNT